MKDYNGFSAEFRTKAYNKQKALGLMIPISKMPCDICGGSGGLMMGHTENYNDLNDLRPVCVECHMKLHARFSRPGFWIAHLIIVRAGIRPVQWKTTSAYFAGQKDQVRPVRTEPWIDEQGGYNVEYAVDVSKVDPATLGDKWYHKLLMHKINLCDMTTNGI